MDALAAGRPPVPRRVFARHAVSLLLVRPGPHGPEVLMGVRHAAHRFMPNRLVFPGGAVDPADADAPVAAEPSPALLGMLAGNARPRLARAIAVAAARELEEETGLSLRPSPGTPPRLDRLRYLCRAITPPALPIRFNARFLVAPADATTGTLADSDELQDLGWRGLSAVEGNVMAVTREVLARLREWLALAEPDCDGRPLHVFRDDRWQPDRPRPGRAVATP